MATAPAPAKPAIRVARTYAAPRERVFRAWTEPEALTRWFAPADEYRTTVLELDVRPGGRYRVEMRLQDDAYVVAGTFREVRPPERLVFTWRWEYEGPSAPESIVAVDFLDRGAATELVLSHERIADEESRAKHEHGWKGCLDRLGRAV